MEEGEELSFWGIRCIDEDERYPFLIKAEGPELADIELPACVEADYPVLEDIDSDVAKRLPGLLIGFGGRAEGSIPSVSESGSCYYLGSQGSRSPSGERLP